MSCHYSCASCISSTYADLCQSCVTTRTFVANQCICSGDYYQYQTSQCLQINSMTNFQQNLNLMLEIVFYIMIGISWLQVILNLNRFYSSKTRSLITFSQIISLLLENRFRFTALQQKSLKVLSVWNFNYFNTLICNSQSRPYQCQNYEIIIGPIFLLLAFLVGLLISFGITKTWVLKILKNQEEQQQRVKQAQFPNNPSYKPFQTPVTRTLSFKQYVSICWPSFILIYLDYTMIFTVTQFSRIGYISTYTMLLFVPLVVILMVYILRTLHVINSASQFQVEYRSQNSYFFLYDQNYHLNYLDYLFEEQQRAHIQKSSYVKNRYLPHSNYIVLQICMKFVIAAVTIVLFQQKPHYLVIMLLVVMIIALIKLNVFKVYQRSNLLVYIILWIITFISYFTFYYSYFFVVFAILNAMLISAAFIIQIISAISDWNRQRQGKYYAIAFQYLNGVQQGPQHVFTQPHIIQNFNHQENQIEQKENQDLAQKSSIKLIKRNNIESILNNTKTVFQQRVKTSMSKEGSRQKNTDQTSKIFNPQQQKSQKSKSKLNFLQMTKSKISSSENVSIKDHPNIDKQEFLPQIQEQGSQIESIMLNMRNPSQKPFSQQNLLVNKSKENISQDKQIGFAKKWKGKSKRQNKTQKNAFTTQQQ